MQVCLDVIAQDYLSRCAMTYSEQLKAARLRLKLTQEQAAEKIGVSRVAYADWESGRAQPRPNYFAAIADAIGLEFKLTAQEPSASYLPENRYAYIKKYNARAGAGIGQDNEHEEVQGRYAYRRDWLEKQKLIPAALVVIEADGESMHPTVFDGDDVLINTAQKAIISGKVYAFRTDEGARIKRLFKQLDGRIRVASDNPDKITYPDEFLTPGMDVDIIGMVVHRSGGV